MLHNPPTYQHTYTQSKMHQNTRKILLNTSDMLSKSTIKPQKTLQNDPKRMQKAFTIHQMPSKLPNTHHNSPKLTKYSPKLTKTHQNPPKRLQNGILSASTLHPAWLQIIQRHPKPYKNLQNIRKLPCGSIIIQYTCLDCVAGAHSLRASLREPQSEWALLVLYTKLNTLYIYPPPGIPRSTYVARIHFFRIKIHFSSSWWPRLPPNLLQWPRGPHLYAR